MCASLVVRVRDGRVLGSRGKRGARIGFESCLTSPNSPSDVSNI